VSLSLAVLAATGTLPVAPWHESSPRVVDPGGSAERCGGTPPRSAGSEVERYGRGEGVHRAATLGEGIVAAVTPDATSADRRQGYDQIDVT